MKSIKSVLSVGFVAVIVMLSLNTLNAQSAQSNPQLISQERILTVQAGTAQLVNGSLTVTLNAAALKQLSGKDASYYVSLTPIGETGSLKLKEKSGNQFTVQEIAQQGSNGTFDYVVLVKKTAITGIKPDSMPK